MESSASAPTDAMPDVVGIAEVKEDLGLALSRRVEEHSEGLSVLAAITERRSQREGVIQMMMP